MESHQAVTEHRRDGGNEGATVEIVRMCLILECEKVCVCVCVCVCGRGQKQTCAWQLFKMVVGVIV